MNEHETDVVWRAKTQAEQVRDFITGFLDGFDASGVRAKEAVERGVRFRQKAHMPTSVYLELNRAKAGNLMPGWVIMQRRGGRHVASRGGGGG